MRALTILVLVLAALWSAWWVAGRTATQVALRRAPAVAAEQGWDIAWEDASTRGFPNRFDTRLEAPRVARPASDVEWAAPFLDLLMLSYRPDHAIVAFPPEQTVTLGGLPIVLRSQRMRASVVADPAVPPTLERATVEGAGLAVETLGAVATIARAQVATRRAEAADGYDVALDVAGLVLPEPAAGMMGEGGLPPEMTSLRVDALLRTDGPVPLGGGTSARVEGIELRDLSLAWGDLAVTGEGTVGFDRAGLAQGDLVLRASGWTRLLDLARSQNLIDDARRALLEAALRGMSGADGEDVEIPLVIRDGTLRFGPLELGRLPRLL